MVSFTFDDVPKSAATVGAPMLEEYGARGTFYVAGGLVDRWSGHWTGGSADEIVAFIAAATKSPATRFRMRGRPTSTRRR